MSLKYYIDKEKNEQFLKKIKRIGEEYNLFPLLNEIIRHSASSIIEYRTRRDNKNNRIYVSYVLLDKNDCVLESTIELKRK